MADVPSFEWDPIKDRANRAKHGVSFRSRSMRFSIRAA